MKRLFSIFAILLLLSAAGCSKSEDVDGASGAGASITFDNDVVPAPVLAVEGGSWEYVGFTATQDWSVECSADWLTIAPKTGTSGYKKIGIKAEKNEGVERKTTVYIKSGDISASFVVTQADDNKPRLEVAQSSYSVAETGGTVTIEVLGNVDYEMTMPSAAWLSDVTASDAAEKTHTIKVEANDSGMTRTADIMFENKANKLEAKVIITQLAGSDAVLIWPNNEETDGITRAFPGAEGAGMYTTGGRGGKVIHVTNLNDSGPGSLRAAIGEKGARTIVFDVAGNIELKSTLKIANGDVTIAGQTAPGDGICIKDYGMEVNADNVIIRFLRIRPGDMAGNDGMDALGGRYMENVIIDHCSLSWSTDECVSFYVNRNMTMQYCLAYESLRNGKHKKGTHGYGGIWGGAPASFHHNILAHHDSRNPRLDSPEQYGDGPTPGDTAKSKGINRTDRLLDFRNNVVYNFCNYPAYGGVDITMNFVGNYYKWGPASVNGAGPNAEGTVQNGKHRQFFASCDTYYDNNGVDQTAEKCVTGNPKIYYGNNTNKLDTSVTTSWNDNGINADNQKGFIAGTTSGKGGSCPWNPVWSSTEYKVVTKGSTNGGKTCSVTTHTADAAFDVLVQYCGASLRQDSADKRVLADVKNGTGVSGKAGETTAAGLPRSWGGLIDTQDEVGGWPQLKATEDELARVKDSDGDGIPDYYEILLGLDANDAADANAKTLDRDQRYTNLEMYLHYLVQDIVAAQVKGGVNTEL